MGPKVIEIISTRKKEANEFENSKKKKIIVMRGSGEWSRKKSLNASTYSGSAKSYFYLSTAGKS
jgi:hypothetical protein